MYRDRTLVRKDGWNISKVHCANCMQSAGKLFEKKVDI